MTTGRINQVANQKAGQIRPRRGGDQRPTRQRDLFAFPTFVSSFAVPLRPGRGHFKYGQVCESFAGREARRVLQPLFSGPRFHFLRHYRTTQAVSAGWLLSCLATICARGWPGEPADVTTALAVRSLGP